MAEAIPFVQSSFAAARGKEEKWMDLLFQFSHRP
jgi:hypothetical protein